MEQKRNIILRGTEAFSRGELDNVSLDNGAIVLDEVAGRHVLYGCYTGPVLPLPPFCNLNVSWNADTPAGTVVEAQCRVLAAEEWSGWKSFGKWSPDYPRASVRAAADAADEQFVFVMGDMVTVAVPGGATAAQVRLYLYTEDERATPSVRLLAAAARPLQWQREAGRPVNRQLFLPAYDAASHDPSFGASMDLPLTLAALINRYGSDVLPEELAYGMSDGATADCRNVAYAAAMAGCCGYECYQAWMDLKDLRDEVRQGYSVGVELERGAMGREGSAWMGLRGFGHDDAVLADYVQLNDPAAPKGAVVRTMALKDFARYFTGRALVLHPKARGVRASRPLRASYSFKPAGPPGEYQFLRGGAPAPLPGGFNGWLACAPRGGAACATTAQRTFFRLEKTPEGGFRLPEELRSAGGRYTVFAVDSTGALRVGELQLTPYDGQPAQGAAPARLTPAAQPKGGTTT